jgi:hypothetical protein
VEVKGRAAFTALPRICYDLGYGSMVPNEKLSMSGVAPGGCWRCRTHVCIGQGREDHFPVAVGHTAAELGVSRMCVPIVPWGHRGRSGGVTRPGARTGHEWGPGLITVSLAGWNERAGEPREWPGGGGFPVGEADGPAWPGPTAFVAQACAFGPVDFPQIRSELVAAVRGWALAGHHFTARDCRDVPCAPAAVTAPCAV